MERNGFETVVDSEKIKIKNTSIVIQYFMAFNRIIRNHSFKIKTVFDVKTFFKFF